MKKSQKIKDYEELKKYMAEFYDAQCARMFNVSRERIRQLRIKWKIPMTDTKQICRLSSINQDDAIIIFSMLKDKKNIQDIAVKIKRTKRQIHAFLKKHNTKVSDYHREYLKLNKSHRRKPQELEKAKKMYSEGKTIYFIGKTLNITMKTAYDWQKSGHFENIKVEK